MKEAGWNERVEDRVEVKSGGEGRVAEVWVLEVK